MAVTKEYRCLAHGPFDSADGRCPHGCTTVIREFRTAPGTRSDRSKSIDKTLARLADRFGLSDMSNRNGSVGGTRAAAAGSMAPVWGEIPRGNVFEVGKGERPVDGAQGGATAALEGMHMDSGSAAKAMEAKYGQKFEQEPSFMDVAKALPTVRPHVVAQSGTGADLAKAIERSE